MNWRPAGSCFAENTLRQCGSGRASWCVWFPMPLVLLEGFAELAQFGVLLAAADGYGDAHLIGVAQHTIVGIDDDAFGLAESIDGELRGSAHDVDALLFGIAFGFDLEVDRH